MKIYKSNSLSVSLYECNALFCSWREDSQNVEQRSEENVWIDERGTTRGEWRKVHNEEHHNLCA